MKYRTMIEVICDASNSEEASNIAGDYLRGEVDFGVEMRCKTVSLWGHRVKKYSSIFVLAFLVLSSFFVDFNPIFTLNKSNSGIVARFQNTYTLLPALKTKHKADFKKEWDQKRQEAMMELDKK